MKRIIPILLMVVLVSGCKPTRQSHIDSSPTNDLVAWHMDRLNRKASAQEHKVVLRALELMTNNQVRTDYPLRSIAQNPTNAEWVLEFNTMKPDGAFWLYLKDLTSTTFEVQWCPLPGRSLYGKKKK